MTVRAVLDTSGLVVLEIERPGGAVLRVPLTVECATELVEQLAGRLSEARKDPELMKSLASRGVSLLVDALWKGNR